jgi:hypothetical protein
MIGEYGDVLRTSRLYLQHEGPHGSLSTEGKTLLSQLNMIVEDVSWELFEERFRERYLSEEFMERQLTKFNAL